MWGTQWWYNFKLSETWEPLNKWPFQNPHFLGG
jgi:hypothetical protein